MFREKTIEKDGLYAVWRQAIHRGALLDTLKIFIVVVGIALAITIFFG